MIQIACVFVGKKYSPEYVLKMHSAAVNQMPISGWGFTVLTDQPELFRGFRYNVVDVSRYALPGYWNKIALFHPDTFYKGDRVIYLDLDVLITGQLEKLLAFKPKPMVIMRDPIMEGRFNSSVMMWEAGTPVIQQIWDRWVAEGKPYGTRLKHTKGDQAWIEWTFRNPLEGKPQLPQLWDDDLVVGYYKPNPNGEKGWAKLQSPQGASVVVFHGAPRFHDAEMAQWVKELWV